MAGEPELIADYACVVGEGPLWHPGERRLYWVDIERGRIFRYDPASGRHEICYQGDTVGGFTIQADGALLLCMARGAIKTWQDGRLATLVDEIPEERDARFNDVIADPAGRVFCGTMPSCDHLGRLYRLDLSGTLAVAVPDVDVSNGLGFTPDRRQMYYTESNTHRIWLFDYDGESGELRNRRVFVDTAGEPGVPDGMTVDAEGYVWSARWDGACLVRYSPEGREVQRIMFPAMKVSSVTFAGDDYTDMYVTTAGGDSKATDGEGAGALFRLRLGIRGLPDFPSRISL